VGINSHIQQIINIIELYDQQLKDLTEARFREVKWLGSHFDNSVMIQFKRYATIDTETQGGEGGGGVTRA
jgi:hypothetical protein